MDLCPKRKGIIIIICSLDFHFDLSRTLTLLGHFLDLFLDLELKKVGKAGFIFFVWRKFKVMRKSGARNFPVDPLSWEQLFPLPPFLMAFPFPDLKIRRFDVFHFASNFFPEFFLSSFSLFFSKIARLKES